MMSTRPIGNDEDIIDSRDIIARIDYLRGLPYSGLSRASSPDPEMQELRALEALAEEECMYAENWEYGAALIRDSYFEDYARELAEEIGAIDRVINEWPLYCIDWGRAARELRQDYTAVDFDGVTYWIR